jgi:hypothetical protein
MQASPSTPLPPSPNSKGPVLEIFIERFVSAFSPQDDRGSGSSKLIQDVAASRMFSPLVSETINAVSTTFFGQLCFDPGIESLGYKNYPYLLRRLQQAICDPAESKSSAVLSTVATLMCFEVSASF